MRTVRNRLTYRGLQQMLARRCPGKEGRWLSELWGEIRDRPISQHEMAAAMRHCATGPPRNKRLWLPKLARFLACKPRLDIKDGTPKFIGMEEGLKIADEVVERNAGAFEELAKH